jgi:cob(I)alamin adenosyltransferase
MIHIYTGDGKGKTTAGVGLAIRAAAAGYKVLFVQFLKDGSSSEVEILKDAQNIYYRAFGNGDFVNGKHDVQESKVREGLSYVRTNADSYDVIVLDEAVTTVNAGLIDEADLLTTIKQIESGHEVILTGRGATENLVKLADLVTEMKKIKHYHDNGQKSRKGIEY